jgi:hypothetical protein
MQPSNKLPFALGFIITYRNLLQKEVLYCLVIVKKMGSRQKAVKAFLAVCDAGSPASPCLEPFFLQNTTK